MSIIAFIVRTERAALVVLRTSTPFSDLEMRHIAGAAIDSPESVLALSKVCPIPAGFDL